MQKMEFYMHNKAAKNLLFLVINLIFALSAAHAQSFTDANPTDFYHPNIAFINPAAISFQDAQFIVGSQALHYGFLSGNSFGIRNDFFQVSYPHVRGWNLGLGLNASRLSTSIFNQSRMSVLTSVELDQKFSFGLNIGFINNAFDQENFKLIDENDPVFAGGASAFVLNFGVGLIYKQNERWRYSLGLDQLNRPDVSLIGADEKLPVAAHVAARYTHRLFESTLGLRMLEGHVEPIVEFSIDYQGVGLLRAGLQGNNLAAGSQIHISDKISIDYQYAYALSELSDFNNGSHRLNFIYRLGKTPKIDYIVNAVNDSLLISDRRVRQHIDLPLADKAPTLAPDLVEKAKFTGKPEQAYYIFVPSKDVEPIPKIDFGAYYNKYQELVEDVLDLLLHDSHLKLRIIVKKKRERVASAFVRFFKSEYGISAHRLEYGYAEKHATNGHVNDLKDMSHSLSSEQNMFIIKPRIKRKYNRFIDISEWRLAIMATDGTVLKEFVGQFELPERIHWDWKTNTGKLFDAGRYFYYLEWRDKTGNLTRSGISSLNISRFKRDVKVEVKNVAPAKSKVARRIDLMLGL